jgi:regulator of replication initiation timing
MSPQRQIKMAAARLKMSTDMTVDELRDTIVKLTVENLQLRQTVADLTEEKVKLETDIDQLRRHLATE